MTTYSYACLECCGVCCSTFDLQVEIDSDCGCFTSGTYTLLHEMGVPAWELSEDDHGTYCTFEVTCDPEAGTYVVRAALRRTDLGVIPLLHDVEEQEFVLADCDDPIDWSITLNASEDNFICPGGSVTFTLSKV